MINKKKLSARIFLLIFFIFFLNLITLKLHWYFSIWWFDMFMHFLGGFWCGLAFLWLFPLENFSFKDIFRVFLSVLIIYLGWELFEILIDKFITGNSFNIFDTLSDICFDLAGGIVSVFYFYKRIMIK